MQAKLKLGVLVYDWYFKQKAPGGRLKLIVPFAQEIEKMGYHGIWLTEHHESGIAWSCPDTLIGPLAQATSKIKVGTAGVQLLAYNPLKLATDFKCLSALYPTRIALGIGSGLVNYNHYGLSKSLPVSKKEISTLFKQKVRDLQLLLLGKAIKNGEFRGCIAFPQGKHMPELWVLGMGGLGFDTAREFGLNYNHGLTTDKSFPEDKSVIRKIQSFGNSKKDNGQRKCITVGIVCAKTNLKAEQAYERSLKLSNIKTAPPQLIIVGSPDLCRKKLLEIQNDFKVNEINLRTLKAPQDEILERFDLISKVCGLK